VAQMRAGGRGMGMHGCWSLSRSGSSTREWCRPFCRPDTGLTTAFTAGADPQRLSPRPPRLLLAPVPAGNPTVALFRQGPNPFALHGQGPNPFALHGQGSNPFALYARGPNPIPLSLAGWPFGLIQQTVPSHRRAGRHRSRLLRTGSPRSNRSIGGHVDRLLRWSRSQRHRCRLLGSGGVQVPDGDLVTGVVGVQGVGESRGRGNALAVHRGDGVALCELGLLGR
jgi:hypothetical protein